uniref:Uncharacterized protein n=1 Tax=Mycobacterium avium subsp. hominissuis TaxID=439334 RepID=A0A088DHT5_MYCAV|nr:hypothetical protein [Mycobacterium avium subsp. hominissuis]
MSLVMVRPLSLKPRAALIHTWVLVSASSAFIAERHPRRVRVPAAQVGRVRGMAS